MELARTYWFMLIALLAGCHRSAPYLTTPKSAESKVAGLADWNTKREQGIDFVAVGAGRGTANWQLDIDFSKQMRFQTLAGQELLTAMPKPQPSQRGAGVVLDSRSAPLYASAHQSLATSRRSTGNRNQLKVTIEPASYRDPLTKRDYAYTVRVDANGKPYVGGGTFIRAANRLSGTWTVETFKGQRLRPDQFGDKALPVLGIDLGKGKLTGSTGWNKLKGQIQANGDRLLIDPRTGPRQPEPGSFEADFVESLRQASLFRVGKDRLTLLVNGQYVMSLRKE